MCGIAGVLPPLSDSEFRVVLDRIAPRGPDAEGIWRSEDILLGHRMLSVMSPKGTETQPFIYGPLVVTYNGEIYNFPELREDLKKRGHVFKTQGDTEVLAASWLEWGPDCLQKFNGMWAFGIWDTRSKKLFLARDRFGKKPLFWIREKNRFAFASLISALIPLIHEKEIHPEFEKMKDNIFSYESTQDCLIKNVFRFPAAHWGEWNGSQLTLHRWYQTLDYLHPVPRSYSEQVEQFREILSDAVKIRLRASSPAAVSVSGGVDSTSILSLIHQHSLQPVSGVSERKVQPFSVSFPGTPLNESAWAKKTCDYFHLPLEELVCEPEAALQSLPQDIFRFEEIGITPPSPMMMLYRKMREKGFVFSLEGHGADELFSGYDTFLLHALKETGLNPIRIRRILTTYRGLSPSGEVQFRRDPVSWRNYRIQVSGRPEWKFFLPHLKKEMQKAIRHPQHSDSSLSPFNDDLYGLFHTENLPALLRNYDRYSMASGLELRMPFLDPRVVAYAFSLPWTSKIRNGFSKALLRDAVAPFAPKEVIFRKWKMGFQAPILNWLRGPWKSWIQDTLSSRDFELSPLVDAAQTRKLFSEVFNSPDCTYRSAEIAWTSFYPYLWGKYFFEKA